MNKILTVVKSVSEAIETSLSGNTDNVYFIKEQDLEGYVSNQDSFIFKIFGDNLSGLKVNFIYKDGDPDLDPDVLNSEIKIALMNNN